VTVLALHVHHGLSDHADAWLAHCAATCRRWARRGLAVEFASRTLVGRPGPAESVEAWARSARYRALRQLALEGGADLVLLGHHRRDQAETILLQSLRGGGVAALAAMPRVVRRDGIVWARPWLAQPREAIEAYARRQRLGWIEDDSNDDDRFARNRLRRHVWPALVAAFPDAEAALAGTAARVAHAATLIDEAGAEDAATLAGDDGFDLTRWRRLSSPRQRQSLVAWLRREFVQPVPASLVERLLTEATIEGHGRWLFAGGELRCYRGRLQRTVATTAPDAAPAPLAIDLSHPGVHAVSPWRGTFRVEHVDRGGVAAADAAGLVLRARAPGDRFQAGPRRPARSLKLQYQAHGIAPPMRRGPIVCRGDGLTVFVPGLGVDARALAADGEPQVSLTWLPDGDGDRDGAAEGAR